MNPEVVDSSISSNIYAPSVLVGIFVVLFIPYSYSAFQRNRKNEYGIFMTLGMSELQAAVNMLLENCIIAGLSLISGLFIGTVISYLFYYIIQNVIGIPGLSWYLNVASYQYTALLYLITVLITLGTGMVSFMKAQLMDLIKERYRAERIGKQLPGLFAAGIGLILISIIVMITWYRDHSGSALLASLGILFVGTYLVMTHLNGTKKLIAIIDQRYAKRHILELSMISRHQKSRHRIVVIAAWMTGLSVFFVGMLVVSYSSFTKNAINYSPYDMVYSEIFGMNQSDEKESISLLRQNGVT
jgi:predicted lysophospholipase L1 biosynthesis ABC-type transport system permease subunit